jgi:hypothetical protein
MTSTRFYALLLTALPVGACIAPFSEMQSARLLGPGGKEVTPFYSEVGTGEGSEHDKVYNQFGVQFGAGLSEKVDFRARVERQVVTGEPDDAITVLGAGPKFSLVKDRVAAYIPVGIGFGQDMFSAQIHPTLLFTLPVSRSFEINPSTKLLVPLSGEGSEVLWPSPLTACRYLERACVLSFRTHHRDIYYFVEDAKAALEEIVPCHFQPYWGIGRDVPGQVVPANSSRFVRNAHRRRAEYGRNFRLRPVCFVKQ